MSKNERQLTFEDVFPVPSQVTEQLLKERSPVSLLLDGLKNPLNIGMIFRLAEAARIKKIYTYNMLDFKQSKKLSKVARSTDKYLEVEHIYKLEGVKNLKEENDLIGLEITTHSKPYYKFKPVRPLVLIIGNEKHGISQEIIDLSDQCIHIPMLGVNTSMNVAIASGIGVYHLLEAGGWMDGGRLITPPS